MQVQTQLSAGSQLMRNLLDDARAFHAWRHINNQVLYVQAVHRSGGPGDRYSYTSDPSKAAALTLHQCRLFNTYMRDCASVGYWGVKGDAS